MSEGDDFQPLPSMMGLAASGDDRPEILRAARAERRALKRQAFDDQILAALLSRYGGDPRTAALYWRLSRTVLALSTGRDRFQSVEEALSYIDEMTHAEPVD